MNYEIEKSLAMALALILLEDGANRLEYYIREYDMPSWVRDNRIPTGKAIKVTIEYVEANPHE